jgi:hypothetical protein
MPNHIAGKKHQARLQSASSTTPKGSACQYAHSSALSVAMATIPSEQTLPLVSFGSVPTPSRTVDQPSFLQGSALLSRQLVLKKRPAEASAENKATYPEEIRGLLKRKQNVNLYICGGKVVWQFAFNEQVKEAIKTYIKGRQWDTSVGVKGSWTCPLESLPDAIALYEHLGRTPDVELKRRSSEIVTSGGGCSSADVIKCTVHLARPRSETAASIGRVTIAFQYDSELVAAMKRIAPPYRSYEPQSREWTIDLLSLPELLHHFKDVGYVACDNLRNFANLLARVGCLLEASISV